MIIEKRVQKQFFEKILDGSKPFELRLADFECSIGDTFILKEVDEQQQPTGRELTKEITYILKTNDIPFWTKEEINKYGYQIIAFK